MQRSVRDKQVTDRLNELSATEARTLLDQGSISSEQLVRACLDRIHSRDGVVGAWEFIDEEGAIAAARSFDQGNISGPLAGIPVGIKDNFDTFDMPTRYGSRIYKGHRPVSDSACVALLREAGAIILGKTVTSEFAAYSWGKTRNPHDPARTAGISSMGSAAAVADFMVPIAIGSQTSGSIIRPAAFCGALGYKPTFGSFNRSGLKPLAESLDTAGLFGRSVDDVVLATGILAGRDDVQLEAIPGRLRIGLFHAPSWDAVTPDTADALEGARAMLSAAGVEFVEVQAPPISANLSEAHALILQYEAARAFAFERAFHEEDLSDNFRNMVQRGRAISYAEYAGAMALAAKGRQVFTGLFDNFDALLTLAAECDAPSADDPIGHLSFNRFWTLLGLPCLSIPLKPEGKLPVGLLLVGGIGRDTSLLSAGALMHDHLRSPSA